MRSFSIKRRLISFVYALKGACTFIRTQHNAWIHALATVVVIAAGWYYKLNRFDWALVTIALGMVWAAEAFNTAIEFLADEVTLERREGIARAKDIAAFGVLICALAAAVIGGIVFLPRIFGN